MKAYGIFCLLFVLNVYSKQIYQCNATLGKDICTRQSQTDLIWLNPCNESSTLTYCPLKMDGVNDDKCVAQSSSGNLFPGENCTSNTQCLSQTCQIVGSGKVCMPIAKPGDPCDFDSDCDAKYSCVFAQGQPRGVCTVQLDLNGLNCGQTKYDQKCMTGYVCNLKTCVKPFALDVGKEADNPMACNHFHNYYDSNVQKSFCTSGSYLTYFKNSTTPVKCVAAQNNCSYSLNYSSKIVNLGDFPCDFSYNDLDISYCNPGRLQLADQMVILWKYLNDTVNKTKNCHISAGFFCNFYNQTSDFIYKAYIAFIQLTQYNQVYNSSNCVSKTIHSKYTYALNHGGSGFSVYSSTFVMMIIFLVLIF